MKKIYSLILTIIFSISLVAQSPQTWTSADIYLAIKKLNVLGSVLYVAAHPDDENTRLIAYLSKDRLYRTGYLSMTRGDGGQNLIGDEQGIDLGLIRTQELLSARRIDGGEQFFTRAFDFGFSKNPEETFTKWDKEKILSDVVWVIRKFQPDIIITRFPTTGEGGHGHHTASAILANEAFAAAADPTRFVDQLKYVQPWQVKRVLWNTFNFGGTNTQSENQYKLDVGGYNPLLGKSYGEIAAESRSQHKSQGFGVPAGRGEAIEFFTATKGDQPKNDLLEGIDISWKRVSGGEPIEKMVNDISASFDFLHPENSVKGLVRLYKALNAMPAGYWRNKKLDETKQLIEQCSGLWIDVFTTEQFAVQTDSIRLNFQFNNRLGVNATIKGFVVDGFDSLMSQPLARNRNINFAKTIFIPSSKPITQPYWLETKMEPGYFNVTDQTKIGIPDIQPGYVLTVKTNIEGEDLNFSRPVKYKFTDPVRGELYWPLVVVPPVLITPSEDLKIVMNGNDKATGAVSIKGLKRNFTGKIVALSESDMKPLSNFSFATQKVRVNSKGQSLGFEYNGNDIKTSSNILFGVTDTLGNNLIKSDKHEIKYDHIPAINYFHEADVAMKVVNVETYGKKIGYIVGAGDKVPEALEQMGFEVNRLNQKEISKNPLDKFDAIIVGVRAYNTLDWLGNYYEKLMKYVENGGNLIVQYNTSNFISNVRSKMGPYDFTISRNRVTDENATVTFLKPEHPALNFPNKINQDDFKGWIQERSIYDGIDTSGKFEKILAMNDPGEKPDDGSLLIAKYGRGYFTYTGLVFFRELPAGVPGAYRLLANLIALNRKKAF
ncbi:MAG TPA: PIG-L family deacetylase [Chitinophagaceae bacterium]|nr:PIG-L family deacetylase [Chitinophagaceae bacterium]